METYKLKQFFLPTNINYQEKLNHQQLKVVCQADGPCLVLAGAGSGKTRVLIYRLAYLLEKNIPPQNILLVTFTNKAAKEMINRAEILLKSTLNGLWAGTFHHIANIILRKESQYIGYLPNFTIVDREDAKDLIDDCIEELGFLKKEKLFPKKDIILNIFSLAINSQNQIHQIIEQFYPHLEEYILNIKRLYSYYQEKKKNAQIMDFDDLLMYWLKLLNFPQIKDKYSQIFKYILVDEYQDTNRLQFEILRNLASYHKNILVVGDDAQSIYSFRAADINNLLDFPKAFENAKIFKLEINYRSSPQILALANEIIKHNINQFPKTLTAIKKDDCLPTVVKTKDVYQQARFVAQKILELNNEGIPLKEMAVLFRSHFQALELEVELIKRNIPYIVRGGLRFFEQAHIKDVLAYLKTLINPYDELSFKRAICLHKSIGRSTANKIWEKISKEKKDFKQIEKELKNRQKEGFKEFVNLIDTLKNITKPDEAIHQILKIYRDYCFLNFDNPDERILDLEELAKIAKDYQTIKRFIIEISSFEEFKGESRLSATEKDQILILSTIHQAKGLEWEVVFLIGFSDYEFPHPKALNSQKDLEEERRLFYVAVTRTKSILYITYPETKYTFKNGIIISRASQFFYELPKDIYQEISVTDFDSNYL
ncbi:MAG: ATP-dependent helicase [Candidatus Omnitrophica bacterium]|nr:ATP-dependent helicase [Candidatus Omnitrophota bacterium]MCM8831471.1 ATP-dependent helicase [Candidatus Omnitrophota bacterium]